MIKIAFLSFTILSSLAFADLLEGEALKFNSVSTKFCGSHRIPESIENMMAKYTSNATAKGLSFKSIAEAYSFLSNNGKRVWTGGFYSNVFDSKETVSLTISSDRSMEVKRNLNAAKVRSGCSQFKSVLKKTAKAESKYILQNGSLPLSELLLHGFDGTSLKGEILAPVVLPNLQTTLSSDSIFHVGVTSYTHENGKIIDQLYFERHWKHANSQTFKISYLLYSERN